MLAFLGRVVLGTGKFVAKNVLVPIAITAIAAAVLRSIAQRIPEDPHEHTLEAPSEPLG